VKKSTVEAKLNALFGLSKKAEEVKVKATGKVVGVTEDEIQEFRAVQGLHYFLQAPELFTAKVCKHCGEQFLVSRKYVAFCSYTCIQKSLAEQGLSWRKGQDLETLANDPQVFDGNEPLWIRGPLLERLQAILSELPSITKVGDSTPVSTPVEKSDPVVSSSPSTMSGQQQQQSLPAPSQTGVGQKTSATSSRSRKGSRKIIFNT
jgi:hypothetical protein